MAQLIDALLQLSRVTRATLEPKSVDLSAMAREIAADLQSTDPNRQCEFVIESGIVAEADGKLLEVALQNLLGNAWKFTSRKPAARIELYTERIEGTMVCCVRDNGAGFENKYSGKLFTAFQRLHDPRQFEGSGIGLATVSRIVKRHGGRIWAQGEPDRGARFYFTISGLRKDTGEARSA
jgi:light-regulated signal transduction histidine kinase (bacteriophytochrome)